MNITSKLHLESLYGGASILHIEFFKSGDIDGHKLGKLVRPTYKDYAVNQTKSASKFLSFVEDVNLRNDAILGIGYFSNLRLKIIYHGKSNELGLGISGRRASFNSGSSEQMRVMWNGLLRSGFRPSVGMFS